MPDRNDRHARQTKRLLRGVIGFGAVAVALSIGLSGVVFGDSLERQRRESVDLGSHLASVLDHELALREDAVDAMVAEAEDVLAGRLRPAIDVRAHLVAVPEKGGWALALPPGYARSELGALTGLGPIPPPGDPALAELDAAIALAPAFRAATRQSPDVAWVYYIAKRGFAHLYPHAGAEDFFFTRALADEHFAHRARNAHDRRTYWTELYEDRVGKGVVATVSKTVLRDGEVVGTVSIDVALRTLTSILAAHEPGPTTMHVLDAEGRDMVGSDRLPGPVDVSAEARGGVPTELDDRRAYVFGLRRADWHVAAVTPRRAIFLRALRESVVYGLMSLFMLASAVLLVTLGRSLRQVAALSVRDALTGLYNRRHFDEVVRAELAKTRRGALRVGLAILDVDHFKAYNDRHGHHEGDRVLASVACALRASLRRASDVVFRIGGEEFAVLVVVDRPEQLRALGDKLCAAVRALGIPHAASPAGVVTISFGATLVDESTPGDLEAVYQRADAALYRAKKAGRDRVEVDGPSGATATASASANATANATAATATTNAAA